jgi:hypothetical protein
MIHHLRHAHHKIFVVLGVLLPVIFLAGVISRQPSPMMNILPTGLEPARNYSEPMVPAKIFSFVHSRVVAKVSSLQPGNTLFTAEIFGRQASVKPDVLVYWVSGNPGEISDLPAQAILLGELGTSPLALPARAQRSGVLVLYSLADGQVVDFSKPISF